MATTMKAAVLREHGGPEVVRVEDVPRPEAGPGQVLVRVGACGVNRLDLWVREGTVPVKVPLPHISGSEVAGEVAAVGAGVAGRREGQRVAVAPYLHCGQCEYCLAGEETTCLRGDILGLVSQGGYAEYVAVPANSVLPLPDAVSFVDAAATGLAALTAYHLLLTKARVRPGEDVLVLAAGSGVGSAAVQLAKLSGARVIAAAGSDEKLARARDLGADEAINYNAEDLREAVRRITNKRGVDVVVEHVGQATFPASVASLARNGRLVTCGATTGSEAKFDLWSFFAKQLRFIGGYGGTRGELATLLALAARGQFRPVVHATYALDQVGAAQDALASRQTFGKLVVTPA
ncbi:MAG TPA: zinc-binding dehydrogenase [Thermomicrobiales bacterium]|nr:zinc-binding dehydrogenase [Thermomicrobiales bacterium]